MAGFNLPDGFSWREFDAYYGDDQQPEPEDTESCCDHNVPLDTVCDECDVRTGGSIRLFHEPLPEAPDPDDIMLLWASGSEIFIND